MTVLTRSRHWTRNRDGAPQHGTQAGYKAGCRCDDCRRAATRAMKVTRLYRLHHGPREIDSTGTRRRILALMVIGWRHTDIALDSGVTSRTVGRVATGQVDVVNVVTADAIRATYDRLADTAGPGHSKTRRTGRALGGHAPILWDDDIDDPSARPYRSAADRGRVDPDDVAWLLQHDPLLTAAQIGDRMRVTAGAVAVACKRAGREDLRAQLARNAALVANVRGAA